MGRTASNSTLEVKPGETIVGSNNTLRGTCFNVTGSNNKIYGDSVGVTGSNNEIHGRDAVVVGSNNYIYGSARQIRGSNNTVEGDAQTAIQRQLRSPDMLFTHPQPAMLYAPQPTRRVSRRPLHGPLSAWPSGDGQLDTEIIREATQAVSNALTQALGQQEVQQVSVQGKLDKMTDRETDEDSEQCEVCMENARCVALAECGHVVTCVACAKRLVDQNKIKCPNCRKMSDNVMFVRV